MSRFSKVPITFAVAVVIASTSACGPAYDYTDDTPRVMSRAQYASVAECTRDWGRENECELKQQPGASRPTVFGPFYSGSHYYSASGEARAVPSQIHSSQIVSQQATPSSVYSSGKYATGASNFTSTRSTAIASRASSTATSRGGMASAGHASSGGG